jgi:AcrR family transcriptional regulator
MGKSTRSQLSRDDWALAAFRALARGGIEAVAVEPIAAKLGATKGSFYWHFKDRNALIEAALGVWERQLTDAVIDELEKHDDPAERLRMLFTGAFRMAPLERSAEIALLSQPKHPLVGKAVRKVSERRTSYMAKQFELLGCSSEEALDRALLVGYLYLGLLQSRQVLPELVKGEARQRQALLAFEALVGASPAQFEVRMRSSV